MDYLEEVDSDVEQAGLSTRKLMSDLAHYKQLLYEKRREATQATLDAFFSKVLLPEASASDEPHNREEPPTSDDPPASDEPQLRMATGVFTCTNVPSLLSSDVDDPGVI